MNKTNIIAKTLIAGLACVALCGTTLAAPRGGGRPPQKAPTQQKAPAHKAPTHKAPAHHGAPLAHHAPAPAHRHHTPPPPPPHERHHDGHHEGAGWLALGATVIGGIVGACN